MGDTNQATARNGGCNTCNMKPSPLLRRLGWLYLVLVPVIVSIFGFGVGHISYRIYLPVWLINVCLMVASAWALGLHTMRDLENNKAKTALCGFLLVMPWLLISIFFGFGPPPDSTGGWVETSAEQRVRYGILVSAGLFIALGFAFLRQVLHKAGEEMYSLVGITAIMLAMPLFMINMMYWGEYLSEFFRILAASGSETRPDWFQPLRKLFGMISVVEVALTYLATAAFSLSLGRVGWFKKVPVRIYLALSILFLAVVVLSEVFPQTLAIPGFALSIPAMPFLMPYFIGINLLKRAGDAFGDARTASEL